MNTEEKKIEQLLQPRYKVIADYPGNTRPVDSISTEIETALYFDKYPANFKRLEWWEYRKPEEMPAYLRYRENGLVRKVAIFHFTIGQIVFEGGRTRRLTAEWTPVPAPHQ